MSEGVFMCVSEALLGLNEGCVSVLIGEQQHVITTVLGWGKHNRGLTTLMEHINTLCRVWKHKHVIHVNVDR